MSLVGHLRGDLFTSIYLTDCLLSVINQIPSSNLKLFSLY